MFSVYVMRSFKDGKQYTGWTSDLQRRLREHNAGKTESTKRRRPLVLVHSESFDAKDEAEKRERFLKSGRGREELKIMIDGAVPKW